MNFMIALGLVCFPHCKWYIVDGHQFGFFLRTSVIRRVFGESNFTLKMVYTLVIPKVNRLRGESRTVFSKVFKI